MSHHVPENLLAAFVDGDVGEQLAIHIAEHLDECPACATRAAGLEPLAAAFAAVTDPLPPDDLADAVLAAYDRHEQPRMPVQEVLVGGGMVAAAAAIVALAGDPLGMAIEAGRSLHIFSSLASALAIGAQPFSVALTLITLLALGGVVVTLGATSPALLSMRRSS